MNWEYFILACNSTIINNTSFTHIYVIVTAMTANASDMIDATENKYWVVNRGIRIEMSSLQVISPCRISAMCEIGMEIDTEKIRTTK